MKLTERFKLQYKNLPDFQVEVLVEIAKEWALEMVGEDDKPQDTPDHQLRWAVNATKNNIKDRIEGSIK